MRFAIANLGSSGDIHPFLAIARALHEQQHEVHVLSQETHRVQIEAQGLAFRPIASHSHTLKTLEHPDLWHKIRGFGVFWRHLCVPAIGPTVEALTSLVDASPEPLRVMAGPLVLGARLARDSLGLQLTTAHTAPVGLRSLENPQFLSRWKLPDATPIWLRRALWKAVDTRKLDPMALPTLNRWRQALGLPPLTGPVFGEWLQSPEAILGLFPPDFGHRPADWPRRTQCVGFPLYESAEAPAPDPELDHFLTTHPGVVVFFPGSHATAAAGLMRAALELCLAQGIACLALGALAGPLRPAPGLLARSQVRLASVLPRAQVFVHHGGIGCCAQGLHAGVRQIVLPSAFDQFDNHARLLHMQGLAYRAPPATAQQLVRQLVQQIQCPGRPWQTAGDRLDLQISGPHRPNAAVLRAVAHLLGQAEPLGNSAPQWLPPR